MDVHLELQDNVKSIRHPEEESPRGGSCSDGCDPERGNWREEGRGKVREGEEPVGRPSFLGSWSEEERSR